MKVVYYTPTCFLDTVLPLVRSLSSLVDLHLLLEVTPQGWNSNLFDVAPKPFSTGIVDGDEFLHDCFPPGVRAYWKNAARFNVILHSKPRVFHPSSFMLTWQVSRFIRRIRPDVIHFNDVTGRFVPLFLLSPQVPKIFSIHDAIPHTGEYTRRMGIVRRIALKKSSHLIFHSRHTMKAFENDQQSFLPRDVVPFGALDIFHEWQSVTNPSFTESKTVLFMGRLSPYKGIETLISVAPSIAMRVSGVRFIIAGKPVPNYSMPQTPELPRGGIFEVYPEYISNELLCSLFRRSTVVVLPYREASQSGVLLTAYAFQRPVVAHDVGGLAEFIENGETGVLVPGDDPHALADGIVDLLLNPDKRRQMSGRIAQKNMHELSWDRIAASTAGIYREAVTGRKKA